MKPHSPILVHVVISSPLSLLSHTQSVHFFLKLVIKNREGAADRRKKQSSTESSSVTSEKDSVTSTSLASILAESYSDDDEGLEAKKDDSRRIKKETSQPEAQKPPRTKIVKDFEDECGRFAEPAGAFITPNMTLAGERHDMHVAISINELEENDRDLYLSSFYPPNSSTETETSVKTKSTNTTRKNGPTSDISAPKPSVEGRTFSDQYKYHHKHQGGSYDASYQDPRIWYDGSSFDEAHHPSPYNNFHNHQNLGSQQHSEHYHYDNAHYYGSHTHQHYYNRTDQSSSSSPPASVPGFSGHFESV